VVGLVVSRFLGRSGGAEEGLTAGVECELSINLTTPYP
jgi:hypothetical protein